MKEREKWTLERWTVFRGEGEGDDVAGPGNRKDEIKKPCRSLLFFFFLFGEVGLPTVVSTRD